VAGLEDRCAVLPLVMRCCGWHRHLLCYSPGGTEETPVGIYDVLSEVRSAYLLTASPEIQLSKCNSYVRMRATFLSNLTVGTTRYPTRTTKDKGNYTLGARGGGT
jgi:hypothetical protein